jgi:hypothetical protein
MGVSLGTSFYSSCIYNVCCLSSLCVYFCFRWAGTSRDRPTISRLLIIGVTYRTITNEQIKWFVWFNSGKQSEKELEKITTQDWGSKNKYSRMKRRTKNAWLYFVRIRFWVFNGQYISIDKKVVGMFLCLQSSVTAITLSFATWNCWRRPMPCWQHLLLSALRRPLWWTVIGSAETASWCITSCSFVSFEQSRLATWVPRRISCVLSILYVGQSTWSSTAAHYNSYVYF